LEKFIPQLGDKFDYNTMNALSFMEDPAKQPGTVGFIMKSGYILKKRVLRPADVIVVKAKEVEEEQEEPTEQKEEEKKAEGQKKAEDQKQHA